GRTPGTQEVQGWLTVYNGAGLVDDPYEENDTFAQASDLGTLTAKRVITDLVMADAADWYRFTTVAAGTSANTVSISFRNATGNLDVELYDAGDRRLRASTGTGDGETISLTGLPAGTYFVRVFGFQGAVNPNYTLTIAPPAAPPPTGAFNITLRF